MILAANEPYFLPYLGYWQMIAASDLFLVGDDFTYQPRKWANRNLIVVNRRPFWFRVDVKGASSFRYINEIELCPVNSRYLLRVLEMAYRRAPFFADGYALAQRILAFDEGGMLYSFLENSIREVCRYLSIGTPFGRTSDYPGNSSLHREKRIFDLCERSGADVYLNLPGGQALYRYDDFRRHGIDLRFIDPHLEPYPQFTDEFIPRMSILDAIMFNSREQLHDMLAGYSVIHG